MFLTRWANPGLQDRLVGCLAKKQIWSNFKSLVTHDELYPEGHRVIENRLRY